MKVNNSIEKSFSIRKLNFFFSINFSVFFFFLRTLEKKEIFRKNRKEKMSFFYINPKEFFTLNSKGYAHHETLRSSTRHIHPCQTLVDDAAQFNNNGVDGKTNNNGTSSSSYTSTTAGYQPQRKRNFFNSETSVLLESAATRGAATTNFSSSSASSSNKYIPTRGNL